MSKPVNMNVWRDRPKSVLVKEIMSSFNISLPEIAKAFGTSVSYVNTKLSRNSFSFEDLLLLLYLADLKINIVTDSGDVWKTVSFEELYPEDAASVDKVKGVHEKYLQLRSELAEMKKLYGFKD